MAPMRLLLALAAICACASLAAAQEASPSPSPAVVDPGIADPNWVDPNLQTEGFQAALTPEATAGNPLGLVPAQIQREGMEAPNAGITFSSQHNAEVSLDASNLWTWEFDGYNVENVGLTTVHNIKDPAWPVVATLFQSCSSPDFVPICFGEFNKTDLDALAQGLLDGDGVELGYMDILDAVNDTALGVVTRMANDPSGTQAIFGTFGNDNAESALVGGIDMPVDDDSWIPLTEEEIAELPDPDSLEQQSPAPVRRLLRKLAGWKEQP